MIDPERLADPKRHFSAIVKLWLVDHGHERLCEDLHMLEESLRLLNFSSPLCSSQGGRHRFVLCLTARFFSGAMRHGRDADTESHRFGLTVRRPSSLRIPRISGDDKFPQVAALSNLSALEPDILLLLESDERAILLRVCEEARRVSTSEFSFRLGTKPDVASSPLGYAEELSNFQGAPESLRHHTSAATEDGSMSGTYVVFRRYSLNIEKWRSDRWIIKAEDGTVLKGDAARDSAIGRNVQGHRVGLIRGMPWPDQLESPIGDSISHAFRARPGMLVKTQFGQAIGTRNAAIYRRGFVEEPVGADRPTIHFICYQADIQKTGFEFIHNEWLMASGMFNHTDGLLDPASGFVEPNDVVYAFAPEYRQSLVECLSVG